LGVPVKYTIPRTNILTNYITDVNENSLVDFFWEVPDELMNNI
jgi:hypothetical protein